MRNISIAIASATLCMLCCFRASAQADEIAQLLLNIEKLAQFKQILSDMKKGYEILNGGYNTVKNIAEGNFSLHKAFLDGLLQVSPAVRKYRRIADITNYQLTIVKEYKSAYSKFKQGNCFREDELTYLAGVYTKLFKESLRNLDELLTVITAGQARMSDAERLDAIDRIFDEMEDKLMFLRHFNTSTSLLAVQRAKESNDVQSLRQLHGVR